MRRMKIEVEEDSVVFVDFKYERLLAICYCCGLLGHNDSDCVMAIRKQKEGETSVPQYGKWLRALLRQPRSRDYGGKGGRYGVNKQNDGVESREEGRGGNGGSQLQKDGPMEREKGNSVIPKLSCDEQEKLTVCLEPPNKSEGVDGKGENILTLATSSHHGMEKELIVIDEMVWQQVQEGGKLDDPGAAKIHSSYMGLREPKSLTSPPCHAEVGRLHVPEGNNIADAGKNKGTNFISSMWKRKTREGENMKETLHDQNSSNLGKRGERLEGGEGIDEDYMRKRRKELSIIPNNALAVAAIQPCQDQ